MRCPDCNKFVAYDDSNEPEADDVDIDRDGHVSGSIRVYLTCAECGTDLKEANFDLDVDMSEVVATHRKTVTEDRDEKLADAIAKAEALDTNVDVEKIKTDFEAAHESCELEIAVDTELTSRTEGKGRGLKTFYGYHAVLSVKCSCGHVFADEEHGDDMQASQMDELT